MDARDRAGPGDVQAQRFICVDLAREKTWTVDSYKDDGIYPTVAGNKTLAAILAACLK
jgi:hypothetical protein